MGNSVTNAISKRITSYGGAKAEEVLDKLTNKKKDNVATVSFPHDLKNQAESTYMVIYIMDNVDNKSKFSSTVFNASADEDTYEIKAITFLKDYTKQELDRLKKNLKEMGEEYVKSAKEQVKSWFDEKKKALSDNTEAVQMSETAKRIKEAGEWANEWLVPHRKKSESKALQDSLDPTKNTAGYSLKQAIALQMPSSSLKYNYENGWQSTNTAALNNIRAVLGGVKNLFGDKEDRGTAKKQFSGVMSQVELSVGDLLTGGGYSAAELAAGRQIKNPVLVFNYTVPQPRTFSYDFTLYPRNKDELYTLFNIIQMLKFYALPDVGNTVNNTSMFWSYPAKFAIKFYTNGYENKWFPKTMALGLTSIEETLTGDGGDMAFFENYFEKQSGNPPRVVRLSLRFKELGILSRDYANAGY